MDLLFGASDAEEKRKKEKEIQKKVDILESSSTPLFEDADDLFSPVVMKSSVGGTTRRVQKSSIESSPELEATSTKRADLAAKRAEAQRDLGKAEVQSLGEEASAIQDKIEAGNQAQQELQEIHKKADEQFTKDWENIQVQREELASMKPAAFWTNPGTQDKITMSLAVLLGGVGSASGSTRENAGIAAINSAIEKDLKAFEILTANKIRQIEGSEKNLAIRKARTTELENRVEARRLAALSQIEKSLKILGLNSKSNTVKANAENLALGILEVANEAEAAAQEAIAQRVTTTQDEVVPGTEKKKSVPTIEEALKDPEIGKKIKDQKAWDMVTINNDRLQRIEKAERGLSKADTQIIQSALQEALASLKLEESGDKTGAGMTALGVTALPLIREKLGDAGVAYARDIMAFADDRTRFVSGAAIAPSEFMKEFRKWGMVPGLGREGLTATVGDRRNLLSSMVRASGVAMRTFFEIEG